MPSGTLIMIIDSITNPQGDDMFLIIGSIILFSSLIPFLLLIRDSWNLDNQEANTLAQDGKAE
jgi:hypothetical protein